MFQHISKETGDQYLLHALPPDALLAVDRHLTVCQGCREMLAEACGAGALFAALKRFVDESLDERSPHPDSEQMTAFVEGALNDIDAEIVRSHAVQCPLCLEAMSDLYIFQAEVDSQLLEPRHPSE